MSRWRTFRLEWVRLVRQPWRIAMMLAASAGYGWVGFRIQSGSFPWWIWPPLIIVASASGLVSGMALGSPPVTDASPEPGDDRNGRVPTDPHDSRQEHLTDK
jgi:hypothetical protein